MGRADADVTGVLRACHCHRLLSHSAQGDGHIYQRHRKLKHADVERQDICSTRAGSVVRRRVAPSVAHRYDKNALSAD